MSTTLTLQTEESLRVLGYLALWYFFIYTVKANKMFAKIYWSHSVTTSNKWTFPEWVRRLLDTTEPHKQKWQLFWLQVTMSTGPVMASILHMSISSGLLPKARPGRCYKANSALWRGNAVGTPLFYYKWWLAVCLKSHLTLYMKPKQTHCICLWLGEIGGVHNLGCQYNWIWSWPEGNHLTIPVTDSLIRLLDV